ncbi:hypothetical protein BKA67DRAFT_570622, partial [Truncatella angustata]
MCLQVLLSLFVCNSTPSLRSAQASPVGSHRSLASPSGGIISVECWATVLNCQYLHMGASVYTSALQDYLDYFINYQIMRHFVINFKL